MGSSPKPIGKVCRGSDNSTVLDYQELPKQVTNKGLSKPRESISKGQQDVLLGRNLACHKELLSCGKWVSAFDF